VKLFLTRDELTSRFIKVLADLRKFHLQLINQFIFLFELKRRLLFHFLRVLSDVTLTGSFLQSKDVSIAFSSIKLILRLRQIKIDVAHRCITLSVTELTLRLGQVKRDLGVGAKCTRITIKLPLRFSQVKINWFVASIELALCLG
jgi:hypothetical protein